MKITVDSKVWDFAFQKSKILYDKYIQINYSQKAIKNNSKIIDPYNFNSVYKCSCDRRM